MYKMYNYYENVKNDVENYIKENKEYFKATDLEELEEELNEQCWISDSVTGNCSGSYTFNTNEKNHTEHRKQDCRSHRGVKHRTAPLHS